MKIILYFFKLTFVACIMDEKYRPEIHFSQPRMWMNDPNGLVYHRGVYHLFYQYHPYSTVWGPMHWGHAASRDLIHWTHLPIAIFPDRLGTIFSGCALVDYNNVTGLQRQPKREVLIAVFTQHVFFREEEPQEYIQYQSLAYSNDNGLTWDMYEKNPILRSDDETLKKVDFRDPNIISYKDHFVMVLAAFNKIIFYKSNDLLTWIKLSEFGAEPRSGDHGGVWECPDLIHFEDEDIWVLLVSINPGGPNKGSATQYFVGKFDGITFKNLNPPEKKLWIDYGPDSYAGITWFGKDLKKKTFISWMNNWDYGKSIPTKKWRGQMTIPRYLNVKRVNRSFYLTSTPISLESINDKVFESVKNLKMTYGRDFEELLGDISDMVMNVTLLLDIQKLAENDSFELCFANRKEELCIGFDALSNRYYIDRSEVGNTTFHDLYTLTAFAPRLTDSKLIDLKIIIDKTSVEMFADDGLTVLTSIFFPYKSLNRIEFKLHTTQLSSQLTLIDSSFVTLQSIWNSKTYRRSFSR